MSIFLMLVLCAPRAPSCEVRWAKATYPTSADCERAARAVLAFQERSPEQFPKGLEGVFCEFAQEAPKTYHINRGELP